jgi:hypothetical protein
LLNGVNRSINLNCNTITTSRSPVIEINNIVKDFNDSYDIWILHRTPVIPAGGNFLIQFFRYKDFLTSDIDFIPEIRPYKYGNIATHGLPTNDLVANITPADDNTWRISLINTGTNDVEDVYFTFRRIRTN